jgi:putative (di)nucleoside polyphosphate hydrolase
MSQDLPYRPAVGLMLLNAEDKVFVGQRLDSTLEAWQMPQGGTDPGEDSRDAALRELEEETGIRRALVEIIATASRQLDYDLPADLIGKLWKGRYRGQRQTWYLARFLGRDEDVNIATHEPEFRAWRWIDARELPRLIVPFKRELYAAVLEEFADYLPK